MLGAHRNAVLVGAEEREVEVVARIGEVVGIAAEERHLLLGREDEADVGVLLVAIEPVLRALVERDDVGAQAGASRLSFSMLRDFGAAAPRALPAASAARCDAPRDCAR